MVLYCCAYGCKEIFKRNSGVTFHTFPKDADRRKTWAIRLKKEKFSPSDHSRICSKHFTDDCFDRERFGGTWLKATAVPTIFNFPGNKEKPPKERKPIKRQLSSPVPKRKRKCIDGNQFCSESIFGIELPVVKPSKNELLDVEPSENELLDVEPSETELLDVKPSENELLHVKPTENELLDVKPSISELLHVKPPENELLDVEPSENELLHVKPSENDLLHVKPTETEFLDVKPSISELLHVKPPENELLHVKSTENELLDVEPSGNELLDVKPSESELLHVKPSENELPGIKISKVESVALKPSFVYEPFVQPSIHRPYEKFRYVGDFKENISYSPSQLEKRWEIAKQTIMKQRKKINVLQQNHRRLQKKVLSLTAMLDDFKKKGIN